MRLLFESTIVVGRKKLDYKIYQFRLQPDRYKAESSLTGKPSEQIFFEKRKNRWKADRKECQKLVDVFGLKIEALENKKDIG